MKKTTKKTTALAKTAPAKKTTTKTAPLTVRAESPAVTAPPPQGLKIQGDAIELGALGLVELKLSDQEEQVLSEPVKEADVRVKPNGAVYLPHYAYTRWLNRAFGRLGWALLPASAPKEVVSGKKRQVVQYYVLHVHKMPVAFAAGEQDYWEGNADQSYGDAAEGTVASALRRCMKRIGVGLELWDRQWGHRFLEAHTVKVKVSKKDVKGSVSVKSQWRMKDDPPLPGELAANQRVPAQREPSAGTHRDNDAPITQDQQKRLFTILKHSGRTADWLKAYLRKTINSESTKDITRKDYDTVVRAIEHPDVDNDRPAIIDADTIPWGDYTVDDVREPGEEW